MGTPAGGAGMKVLLVEPGKHPRTVEIEHTLEAMYQVLDCDTITATYPWPDRLALVTDDEGMFSDKIPCRYIRELEQPIMGNFFLCGLGTDDFTDLPEELMEKLVEIILFQVQKKQNKKYRKLLKKACCKHKS